MKLTKRCPNVNNKLAFEGGGRDLRTQAISKNTLLSELATYCGQHVIIGVVGAARRDGQLSTSRRENCQK